MSEPLTTGDEYLSPPPDGNAMHRLSIDLAESDREEIISAFEEIADVQRPMKRNRESSTEENENEKETERELESGAGDWTEVRGKGKRPRKISNEQKEILNEVYIFCKDKLPRQFGLARTLKENGISDVSYVKYLNPYKVRLQFGSASASNKLFQCENLIAKGWKFQKAMEVSYRYGVVKDVDMDLSDKEILDTIYCPDNIELVSIKRLDRRNRDDGGSWCPSESIRLCFNGSILPAFIFVDGMKIKVDPYIFPVTQCSQCWKLGHVRRMCPSKKIFCPKCGDNHENCSSINHKCLNCGGPHMALAKSCPVFLKEKRIRELMAEFGCTYRKALTIYVPPESPIPTEQQFSSKNVFLPEREPSSYRATPPTFADVVKVQAEVHEPIRITHRQVKSSGAQQKKKNRSEEEEEVDWDRWSAKVEAERDKLKGEHEPVCEEEEVSFSDLLFKLKEVVFLRNLSFHEKLYNGIKLCVEWCIIFALQYISEWPFLKSVAEFLFKLV